MIMYSNRNRNYMYLGKNLVFSHYGTVSHKSLHASHILFVKINPLKDIRVCDKIKNKFEGSPRSSAPATIDDASSSYPNPNDRNCSLDRAGVLMQRSPRERSLEAAGDESVEKKTDETSSSLGTAEETRSVSDSVDSSTGTLGTLGSADTLRSAGAIQYEEAMLTSSIGLGLIAEQLNADADRAGPQVDPGEVRDRFLDLLQPLGEEVENFDDEKAEVREALNQVRENFNAIRGEVNPRSANDVTVSVLRTLGQFANRVGRVDPEVVNQPSFIGSMFELIKCFTG